MSHPETPPEAPIRDGSLTVLIEVIPRGASLFGFPLHDKSKSKKLRETVHLGYSTNDAKSVRLKKSNNAKGTIQDDERLGTGSQVAIADAKE
ncbi:hypothetical protein PG996_009211 [Apiospora saccharicola]|uniref:Uncharacterized protein n=1 Tax=Apiospora saccharicola TaxID=335842 RepID=A0ABR1UK42_9PEZI